MKDNTLKFPTDVVDNTEYDSIDRLQLGDTVYKLPTIIKVPTDLNDYVESIKYIVLRLCEHYGYTVDDLTDAKSDNKDYAIITILEVDGYSMPADISSSTARCAKPDYSIYFNILKAMAKYYEWSTIFEVDKDDE